MNCLARVGYATAVVVMLGACGEDGAGAPSDEASANGEGSAPDASKHGAISAEDTGLMSLPTAQDVGIRGWQDADRGRGDGTALEDHSLSRGESSLRAVAQSRPGLSVVRDEEGVGRLTGLVEPGDAEAIEAVLSSASIDIEGMASAPPGNEIRSLTAMSAAVVALVSVDPSADALIGDDAAPGIAARLERAAGAWPTSARVWRVIGAPPDSRMDTDIDFKLENDAEEGEEDSGRDASTLRRLQGRGILEFEPVMDDGGLITAHVSLPYQNQGQHDRELFVEFVYDPGTDQWILKDISSLASLPTARRLHHTGRESELIEKFHTLDILSVLPECFIVVGPDGPLLCK